MRIGFYVQHLLGLGHLRRAALICEAAVRMGHEVVLFSGGRPVPQMMPSSVDLVQLPSLHVGPDGWRDLRDGDDVKVDAAWLDTRRDFLLGSVGRANLDVVIVEAFPFARRQMAFELDPLLRVLANADVPVLCSVRDILQPPKSDARTQEVLDRLGAGFRGVLVHGDASLATLHESFPRADAIPCPVWHTGIVAPEALQTRSRSGPVIVSAGAGRIGEALMRCMVSDRVLSVLADKQVLLLTGPDLPDDVRRDIEASAPDRMIVDTFRSDLPELLAEASLSISFAGYNTVADVLVARCRAVLVAFTGAMSGYAGEQEQALRVDRLATRFGFTGLRDNALSPEILSAAIGEALAKPVPDTTGVDVAGAQRTVQLVEEIARASS